MQGRNLLWVSAAARHLLVLGAHPQAYTAHPKTSSAGSAVRIGQIAHRKAERRIKGRVGDGEEILWKRKPHEKCFLVLPTTV